MTVPVLGEAVVDPSGFFVALRERPVLRRPLLWHAAGGLALGLAAAVRGASDLGEAVDEAAADANSGVVVVAVGLLVVLVLPVFTVLGVLAAGAAAHGVGDLLGSRTALRSSVSMVAVSLVPVAVRNLVLGLALLVGGSAVADRLGALRFGDPFVVAAMAAAYLGSRWTQRLSRPRAAAVALVACAAPVVFQVSFL